MNDDHLVVALRVLQRWLIGVAGTPLPPLGEGLQESIDGEPAHGRAARGCQQ